MTLPPFRQLARLRPVALVAPYGAHETAYDDRSAPASARHRLDVVAPYASVVAELGDPGDADGRLELALEAPGDVRLRGWHDTGGRLGLEVTDALGRTSRHRSRRHGRAAAPVEAVALTLTGPLVTVLSREAGAWVARGRVDLTGRADVHDSTFAAGLAVTHDWRGTGPAPVRRVVAGPFGQLGLRDLRLVTRPDGSPHREGEEVLLTASHAGPGFFAAGHTGVWRLRPVDLTLTHTADLFFTRPDRSGVYGDHATHLLRDGEEWLVATSTWGDFARPSRDRVTTTVGTTGADLTRGGHVVTMRPLRVPTDGLDSVGVWDPHLLRDGDRWLVAFVSATKYFSFHPALASGPTLDTLVLRGADRDRTATEGVTLTRLPEGLRLLASDGRDGPRRLAARFPVFDLALSEVGTLDAPYPTNLPWPTVLPHGDGWLMVTFDGTAYGGALPGYGTHGDVIVLGTGDG